MPLRDHIGHNGSRGRADDADADARPEALHEQPGQGIHQEKTRDAGRVQHDPGEKNGAATEKRKQIAGDETPCQAADDHNARGETSRAQACQISLSGIGGAGDEDQVVGRHDQKVDQRHHIEVAIANLPQRPTGPHVGYARRLLAADAAIKHLISPVHKNRCVGNDYVFSLSCQAEVWSCRPARPGGSRHEMDFCVISRRTSLSALLSLSVMPVPRITDNAWRKCAPASVVAAKLLTNEDSRDLVLASAVATKEL